MAFVAKGRIYALHAGDVVSPKLQILLWATITFQSKRRC